MMKYILLYIAALSPLAFAGCIKERLADAPSGKGEVKVRFQVDLPADASSRAMTAAEENDIASLDLFTFMDYHNTGTYTLLSVQAAVADGTGGYSATLEVFEGKTQKFIVVANAQDNDNYGIKRGDEMSTLLPKLIYEHSAMWPAADGTARPIPMLGYHEQTISASTTQFSAAVGVLRMLARFDVSSAASNFQVTEACIFNRKTRGYIGFDKEANWNGSKVSQPWVPGGNDLTVYYDNNSVPAVSGGIVRSLYTFEAEGVAEADRLDATAIVVGGRYIPAGTLPGDIPSLPVTYYRVNVKPEGSSTPNKISDDILRNHLYDIVVQSVSGNGAATPDDAFKGDVQFKAVITAYDLAQHGVIFDRQYKLQLSDEQFYFGNEGGSPTITVTTDYDGADGAHPAGIYISVAGTASWLTVTNGGANGDMSCTLTLTSAAYPSASADRETSFTITAGNINYKYKVIQSKDPWLTVDADEANLLDGGTKYMQVSSYFNWNVSIKAGTNPYNLVRNLFSISGGEKINEKLYYAVYDNMLLQNPAYDLNFVTLTFTHPDGIYPDKEASLGLVTGIFRESSNCYVLNPGSRPILIPLSRANQSDLGTLIGQSDQLRSEFVWSDNPNGLAANSNISYVTSVDRGQGGYMYVSPGSEEGNAVVGVKTGGNICWSWHIWMLDATNTLQVIDGLMDRDLGAVSAGPWVFPRPPGGMGGPGRETSQEPAVGLNYQWGRKDPFPTTGIRAASGVNPTTGYITGNTLLTSIRNPNNVINDWNYPAGDNSYSWPSKSLYDPCPEGWIVSPVESWQVTAQPLIFVDAFEGRTPNGNFIPCYQYGGSGAWVHSSWLSSPTSNVWTLALENWRNNIYVNSSGSTPAAGQFPVRCVRE